MAPSMQRWPKQLGLARHPLLTNGHLHLQDWTGKMRPDVEGLKYSPWPFLALPGLPKWGCHSPENLKAHAD